MSGLPEDYLKYPNRQYGQDHDFYEWRLSSERPKLKWESGAKVAICLIVPLEFFPLNPSGVPFKHPGAMVTPYPDLRHFTVRDYGNRVGVYRLLEVFENSSIKASFAINQEIARRYPPLITAVNDQGHELVAHGISTDHILDDNDPSREMPISWELGEIVISSSEIEEFQSPSGWLSPARNQSRSTLQNLTEATFKYCLDWEMDQVPVTAKTENGDITLIPNSYELSDFTLLHTRRQTEEAWLKQIVSAIDLLVEEHGKFGGQMLGLTLTPYIIGQPFRIWALRELLSHINARADVSVFTAGSIDQQFRAQT